jgi:thiol-disulfide isomerase/thioredoxin
MHDLYDYRGRIVVLEFMQTTCPHCQRLAQTLERVKAKYGDRVAILSISNPPDNQSTVANYRAKLNVTTPILYDCGQVVSSYMKATPQNPRISIPHLFLIDAAGMIRNDFAYELLTREIFEGEGLVQELDRMLGGPDATTPSTTAPKKKR